VGANEISLIADPEKLFLEELETIERAIEFACRGRALRESADDFASYVKLKLIDNNYAIIRKHDRQSSFAAFISIVVQRLLLDYRIREWGKWRASAHAKRIGEPAITVELMLHRDGHTIDEALPALLRRWPELTRQQVEEIARALPQRGRRPRAVDLEDAADAVGSDASSVTDAAFEADRLDLSRRIAAVVRIFIDTLDDYDRLAFRLRFETGLTVVQISRTLRIEQKPLYRRIKRMLAALRKRLEESGISADDADDVLTSRNTDLDFGFQRQAVGTVLPRAPADEENL